MDRITMGTAAAIVDDLDEIIEKLVDIKSILQGYPEMKARIISAYAAVGEVREQLYNGDF